MRYLTTQSVKETFSPLVNAGWGNFVCKGAFSDFFYKNDEMRLEVTEKGFCYSCGNGCVNLEYQQMDAFSGWLTLPELMDISKKNEVGRVISFKVFSAAGDLSISLPFAIYSVFAGFVSKRAKEWKQTELEQFRRALP